MKVFQQKEELKKHIALLKAKHQSVGFVPTMGALHNGHKSLIEQSASENEWVVCSIFVNPTQFNDKKDLEKYPYDVQKDIDFLNDFKDKLIVYSPNVEDVYPTNQVVEKVDFGILTSTLEAEHRGSHFDGVVDVVRRLLNIVQPDVAYFGEKDFQQLAIIRHFVRKEEIPVTIVGCPIIREEDGLAMSSRNVRLSETERLEAVHLSKTLQKIKAQDKTTDLTSYLSLCVEELNKNPNTKVEYLTCVDTQTLEKCTTWNSSNDIQCCIAAYVGEVRLIDNMKVK